jgi:hypothetical protein
MRLVPLFLALALAACQLPQPFAHVGPVKDNALIELPSGKGVRVTAAPDVAPEFAEPLTEATVRALSEVGIMASTDAARPAGYLLTGDVALIKDTDDGPEVAAFAWKLTSTSGKAVGTFDQKIDGGEAGWLANDPGIFEVVAHDVGPQIVAMLAQDTDPTGTVDGETEAAVPVQQKLYFSGVTGAPGDGNEALARAMADVLKKSGTPLAETEEDANCILSANVTTEPQAVGTSLVGITWRLTDRAGVELGKIDQKNPVRSTLIATRWGNLANMVAEAAADGILDAWDMLTRPTTADSSRRIVVPQ